MACRLSMSFTSPAISTSRTDEDTQDSNRPIARRDRAGQYAAVVFVQDGTAWLSNGAQAAQRSTRREANMRKVVVEAEVSLDGGMGGDNAGFWQQLFSFHSADVTQYLDELLLMPDALLMGRVTYEGFA